MRDLPIRWQLTAFYIVLLALLLAGFGAAVYRQADRTIREDAVARLRDQVEQVWDRDLQGPSPPPKPKPGPASAAAKSGAPDLARAAGALVRELNSRETYVAVYDLNGAVMAQGETFDEVPDWPVASPDEIDRARRGAPAVRVTADRTPRAVLVVIPLALRNGSVAGIVAVATSQEAADAALTTLRRLLLLGVLLASTAGAAIGVPLTRSLLRPLDQVSATAERIAAGDLTERVGRALPGLSQRRHELGRLAAAFDHMVDYLAATLEAQRRFVADAAHELRTPLTAISGMVEMLLLGADRGDPRDTQRALTGIEREAERLTRLVQDLLTLSRLEVGAERLAPGQFVDLAALAADVAQQGQVLAQGQEVVYARTKPAAANGSAEVAAHTAAAGARGPGLGSAEQGGASLLVAGDPDKLKQVLLNLVSNALTHTPAGGRVTVTAGAGDGWAEVTVADTGAGIPPEALARIFDRFYRVETARDRRTGGAGLGLAIAHAIATAHHGALRVTSPGLGRGATFMFSLPLAAPVATAATPGRRTGVLAAGVTAAVGGDAAAATAERPC